MTNMIEEYLKNCKEMEYGIEYKFDVLAEGTCYGFQFYIINYGTHPCSYVEIPIEHRMKGFEDIKVHGGITYSEYGIHELKTNKWFIGWDYMHLGDYSGMFEKDLPALNEGAHKWNIEELLNDVVDVCRQLKEMK